MLGNPWIQRAQARHESEDRHREDGCCKVAENVEAFFVCTKTPSTKDAGVIEGYEEFGFFPTLKKHINLGATAVQN